MQKTSLTRESEEPVATHRRLRCLLAKGPEVRGATRAAMLANRSKDTAPELTVRRALHAVGLRYRLHVRSLPGRPDVVLPSRHMVVEVRGCFWHGHHCQGSRIPKTRSEFWTAKVQINKERDERNEAMLRRLGWKVVVIWECDIKRGLVPLFAEQIAASPRYKAQLVSQGTLNDRDGREPAARRR
jgi:DNA mismatch endonuclease (patch repair protein)